MLASMVATVCLTPAAAGAESHPRGDTATQSRGEPGARVRAEKAPNTAENPVNINTADIKQLMTLDGIGHKVAEKIVQYRDAHGEFKKPEEIRKVDGVGQGLWEKNRTRIVVK